MQLISLNRLGITRALQPPMKLDFTTGVLPAGVTFSRASTGWYFNSAPALVSAAIDVARLGYNRSTGAALGLLVEEAQTNSVRNSTMVGAAAGTPGTAPTNWAVTGSVGGLTRTISPVGSSDNIDYFEARWAGTPSASGSVVVHPEGSTQVAAAAGQTWSTSLFARLAGGSLANLSNITHRIVEISSGGGELTGTTTAPAVTSAALRTQRILLGRTFTDGSAAFAHAYFSFAYTNGSAIDVTFQFGLPGLVRSGATVLAYVAPIKTSTVAVARAADLAFIAHAQALTAPVVIVKGRTPTKTVAGGRNVVWRRDDGTANNHCTIYYDTGKLWVVAGTGGGTQAVLDLGAVANDTDFTIAARFADNSFAASLNGGAVVTDNVGTAPTGLTLVRIGVDDDQHYWNSTIRSIEARRSATDAELLLLAA